MKLIIGQTTPGSGSRGTIVLISTHVPVRRRILILLPQATAHQKALLLELSEYQFTISPALIAPTPDLTVYNRWIIKNATNCNSFLLFPLTIIFISIIQKSYKCLG
jgi:hypothetical protein